MSNSGQLKKRANSSSLLSTDPPSPKRARKISLDASSDGIPASLDASQPVSSCPPSPSVASSASDTEPVVLASDSSSPPPPKPIAIEKKISVDTKPDTVEDGSSTHPVDLTGGVKVDGTSSAREQPANPSQSTEEEKTDTSSTVYDLPFRLTRVASANDIDNRYTYRLRDAVPPGAERILVLNYMIDINFLLQEIPQLADPKVRSLVIHGLRTAEAHAELQHWAPCHMTVQKARGMLEYGTHHSKCIVAYYSDHVRVTICTANFIPRDWADKTQGMWVQNFPLKKNITASPSPFERDLLSYFEGYKKANPNVTAFAEELSLYDFSKSTATIIGSVPGWHSVKDAKYGHLKLAKELASQKTHPDSKTFYQSRLWFQFSSLGSVFEKYLTSELKNSFAMMPPPLRLLPSPPLRIIWPTVETVRTAFEGYAAGESIPCRSKALNKHVRSRLFKYNTAQALRSRKRSTPHIKTYGRMNNAGDMAWCVLTSHNLSKQAWGMVIKKDTPAARHMISSFELGVLFTPDHFAPHNDGDTPKTTATDRSCTPATVRFRQGFLPSTEDGVIHLPIPFDMQWQRYEEGDEPWAWDVSHVVPDSHGKTYNP